MEVDHCISATLQMLEVKSEIHKYNCNEMIKNTAGIPLVRLLSGHHLAYHKLFAYGFLAFDQYKTCSELLCQSCSVFRSFRIPLLHVCKFHIMPTHYNSLKSTAITATHITMHTAQSENIIMQI